jgi:hypothetical protein
MAWTKGFDFRGSSGYVTDPADHTYVIQTDEYPITRNSVTFGLVNASLVLMLDRDSAIDARLAGVGLTNSVGTPGVFRVDLPEAGDYIIRAAFGSATNSTVTSYVKLYDNTSLLATITGSTSAAPSFLDATAVNRTSVADWIANNASITKTFATTTLIMEIGDTGSTFGWMVHLLLDQAVAGLMPLVEDGLSFQRIVTYRQLPG